MRILTIALITLSLISLPTPAVIASPIEPFSSTYEVTGVAPFSIKARIGLETAGDSWRYKVEAKSWLGQYTEASRFKWAGQKAQLLDYSLKVASLGKTIKQRQITHLEDGTWVEHSKDEQWKFQSDQPFFDSLLYQLQIARDLKEGRSKFRYPIGKRGKIQIYEFHTDENREIHTIGNRRFSTIKLTRIDPKKQNRITQLWFAPELDYRLVRGEHADGDKVSSFKLLRP